VALDADGRPVEVEMAVDGPRLVLSVPHRGKDVRYPLLVDPEFVEEWDWENYWDEAPTGWAGFTNQSNTFDWFYDDLPSRWGSALYVATKTGATVSVNNYGGWIFDPQGSASYVYRAEMKASTNALSACMYRGISDGYDTKSNCSAVNYNYTTSCVVVTCDPSAGGNGNYAYMRLQSTTTGTRADATKAVSGLSSATVFYSDRDVPSFAGVNTGGTGTAWAKSYSGLIDGTITDGSLGMYDYEIWAAGTELFTDWNDCEGNAHEPCPATLPISYILDTGVPPLDGAGFEGKHEVAIKAWDALDNNTTSTWGNLWIDRSGPSLALSGSLWNGRVVTEPGTALSASYDHGLTVAATDGVQGGTNAQRRSGVKSVEIRVDGEKVAGSADVPCSTDSCPLTHKYVFSTGEFSAGRHTVTVVAKDQVGNQTTSSFDVIVPVAGELLQPQTDSSTSRWIQFEAHADNTSFTTVKFQYRRPNTGWIDVPQSAMVDSKGQSVTTINHALTNGNSPVISWDVPVTWALLGAEPGPLDVRARFSDGSGPGGSSKTVRVTFDPRGLGTANARSSLAPGKVDLVTGNFSYEARDATLESALGDIGFHRTFNSRDPQANVNGPLGPGWVTSLPISSASEFASIHEFGDAVNGSYVELTLSDGGKIYFFPQPGGGYVSDVGAETLTLTKPASDRFQLNDRDGISTLFVHQASTPASQYDFSSVSVPGAGSVGSFVYDASGRLSQIIATPPPGVSCTAANSNSDGCRTLIFTYAASTTATGTDEAQWGNYAGRLKWIEMKAWSSSGPWTDRPAQFAYDSTGKLRAVWDARLGTSRKTRYSYDASGRLTLIVPPGENAWSISYQQLVGDGDGGRLRSVTRKTPQGTATSTVAYNVPVSGLTAPYQMGLTDVDDWSQDDYSVTATAVFPADQVPASSPSSYSRATVHYMNRAGREVNQVSPGGATTTAEYDRYGNVTRELSAANRARALASGSLSAQVAERLDKQMTYQDQGTEMVDSLGPEHEVKLKDDSVVQARSHMQLVFDEGAPAGKNPHRATTLTTSAQVVGGPASADARVMKYEYDWTLLKTTKSVTDHGGLNLTRKYTYDSAGRQLTVTMPKSGSSVRNTTYYTSTGSGPCGGKARWHGLLCQSFVSASGLPDSLPALQVKTFTYDRSLQVAATTSAADGEQRTTSNTYNAVGDLQSSQTTSIGGSSAGLVAAYGFEEASGTTATDVSATGNNGALENGATRVDYGRFGRGVLFDGTNDQVRVPDASSLDVTDLTIEAWVRTDVVGGTRTVVSRGSTASGCTGPLYGMRLSAATTPQGGSCGTWASGTGSAASVREGMWSHVAVTRSGTNMWIYRNGEQIYTGTVEAQTNDTADLLIGAGTGGQFSGVIDEVRVYNRALSQTEIDKDMRRPVVAGAKRPASSPQTGLVAAYGFDEKPTSTTLREATGGGNDAQLAGSRVFAGHDGGALAANAEYTDAPGFKIPNAFTVETWFGFDTSNPYYDLYPVSILNGGAFQLYYGGNSGLYLNVYAGGDMHTVSTGLFGTSAQHIAATYDGSTVRLFLDGVEKASLAVNQQLDPYGGYLVFGDSSYKTTILDEVKVFDHARTATQIQTDSTTPLGDAYELPSNGEPVASTNITYDSTTGRPLTQWMTDNGMTRTITTGYDALGRVTSYTDADGNTTTTAYDLLSRPTVVSDGKGTKTFGYHSTTGQVSQLQDSQAGTFTVQVDPDGKITSQTYPNGLVADTIYDENADPVALSYTKTTNCSSNCVWYDEEVQRSIFGEWLRRDSSLSDQDYVYDNAGRLTLAKDTPTGQGCTTRAYTYDANSNRTGLTTRAPGVGGACDTTSTGQAQGYTYDNADRLTSAGVSYDTWGRVTSLPGAYAGGDTLNTTYYVNDMVRTEAQGAVSKGWLLDPTHTRHRASIPSGTTQEIMHYADGSDSLAWSEIKVNGTTQSWERMVTGIDGNLAAVVSNDGSSTTTKLKLPNLHGDIVATASADPNAGGLLSTSESDEFGNPRGGTTSNTYQYQGAKQRRTVMPSGVIQMGVRSYVPAMGRFTSVDPVADGSANAYDYAYQNPVNNSDPDGRCTVQFHYVVGKHSHVTAYLDKDCTVSLWKLIRGRDYEAGLAHSACAYVGLMLGGPVGGFVGATCVLIVKVLWNSIVKNARYAAGTARCLTLYVPGPGIGTPGDMPPGMHFGASKRPEWCDKKKRNRR
jgi:RHS repeat-associated protein